jgi:hypothetical protein
VITATDSEAKLQGLELARDLSSPQEYLKFLRSIFSEITNVPESDPERLKIGASSGFALEVLFNDLLLKTELKRAFYGKGLIELNRRLLELSGLERIIKLSFIGITRYRLTRHHKLLQINLI